MFTTEGPSVSARVTKDGSGALAGAVFPVEADVFAWTSPVTSNYDEMSTPAKRHTAANRATAGYLKFPVFT